MDLTPLMGPEKYGIPTSGPVSGTPTAQASMVTPSAAAARAHGALSLENPLVALGILGVFTFGLMAFSTSVRAGHATAKLSIGDV